MINQQLLTALQTIIYQVKNNNKKDDFLNCLETVEKNNDMKEYNR
jgi:hypothetical protein